MGDFQDGTPFLVYDACFDFDEGPQKPDIQFDLETEVTSSLLFKNSEQIEELKESTTVRYQQAALLEFPNGLYELPKDSNKFLTKAYLYFSNRDNTSWNTNTVDFAIKNMIIPDLSRFVKN